MREGTRVSIEHSRYQFFPNASDMDTECREKLREKVARDFPQTKYEFSEVKTKHGRNILLGISNCECSVIVAAAPATPPDKARASSALQQPPPQLTSMPPGAGSAATVIPVVAAKAAPTSSPTAPTAVGSSSHDVERLARDQACNVQPKATLTAKGPGFEAYVVQCSNGDALAFRCEFGNCRMLK